MTIPLQKIEAAYQKAKASYDYRHKSLHWDVFGGDFSRLFADATFWDNLRNREVTSGMGGGGFSSERSLVIADQELAANIASWYRLLVGKFGRQLIDSALDSVVCNPEYTLVDGVKVARQDVRLVHNLLQISPYMTADAQPVIVEIGCGYGGFSGKLKTFFPKARIILIDLPEVNAVQAYYLSAVHPDANILTYDDFCADKEAILKNLDFDFLILPGWEIGSINSQSVDQVISLRAMMEFNLDVVLLYTSNIQRMIKPGGLLYIVNRLQKSSIGEKNVFKNYDFDNHWCVTRSETAFVQPQLHEIIAYRTPYPVVKSIKAVLADLPPYSPAEILGVLREAWARFLTTAWRGHPGQEGAWLPNLARRGLSRFPGLRPLLHYLKRCIGP